MHCSILKLFGISELKEASVSVDNNSVFVEGKLEGRSSCPKCRSSHLNRKSKNHRILHLPPVCGKIAKLQVLVQKQLCVDCQYSWWPSLPFTRGKERITASFIDYALALLRFGTIKDVSNHLHISWDIIKSIHKKYLKNRYEEIDMSEVEYVSIDEFSIAKRHKYMTIIVDIQTGRIIYAVEGRKKDDVEPILKELKKKHPKLKPLLWI